MEIVPRLTPGVRLVFLVMGLAGIAHSQNGMPNTTLNPFPPPTDVPTPAPSSQMPFPSSSIQAPSGIPSDITCCYVQTACNNCTESFKVNSIVYCCPNCVGMVLVTDLVCRCTVPKGTQASNLKCTLSDNVVGDYPALRPSYPDASGGKILGSSLFGVVVAGLLAVVVL